MRGKRAKQLRKLATKEKLDYKKLKKAYSVGAVRIKNV